MKVAIDKKLNLNKSSWKPVKFGDVVTEPKESTRDIVGDGFKHIVGLEHIDTENIHLKRWMEVGGETTFSKVFRKGDVLFGRRRAYLKKAALANFDGVCSGDITVFRTKSNLIPELLPFIVNNERFFDYAIKHSAGGLSPRVKFKDLANFEFLLPPKEEQKKLAELLWAMDDVIEKEKRLLATLDSTYLSIIEKKLIDHTQQKMFIAQMGEVIRGVNYKPEDLLDEIDENSCIILRSNNISDGKINFNDIKILPKNKVKDNQILKSDDFAICMSNGSKELVGKASRFYTSPNYLSIGSFCAGFRPKNTLYSDILQHLFASENYRQKIKRTLSGSAINNLKPSDIEELFFRINPSSTETTKIIKNLNVISKSKIDTENKTFSSQTLQKSLINQIF